MKKHFLAKALFFLISLGFIVCGTAGAATITYTLTDLTDTQDNLYQIVYNVSGFDSTTYAGFDILFDYETYSDLTLVSADTINWDDDTYVGQPDNMLGEEEDGTLDAMAKVISNSLTGSFTVTFIYTGEGLPGVQDVQYFDTDWNVAATGQTSAVPVPGSFFVLFSGIAGLCALKPKF